MSVKDVAKVATPELDKMAKVREESQAIGEFLDWLSTEKKATLATIEDGHNYPQWWSYSVEELLAEFFGIDLRKVEAERRAILDAIRKGE